MSLRAQLAALEAVRAGCRRYGGRCGRRAIIEAAGLGGRFGHGLGHGVGLEVHEQPWLTPSSTSTLAAGNVVTVEPGIYLPGSAAFASRTS